MTVIHIGPFQIHTWGLLVAIGLFAGYLAATWAARRRGVSMEHLSYLALSGIVGGVLGARLAFALQPSEIHETLQHPIRLIAVWQPGLSLIGGIILGFLAAGIYAWRVEAPSSEHIDVRHFWPRPGGCHRPNGLLSQWSTPR